MKELDFDNLYIIMENLSKIIPYVEYFDFRPFSCKGFSIPEVFDIISLESHWNLWVEEQMMDYQYE